MEGSTEKNAENRKSNAINLLLIMLTNFLAPLVAHLLDMILGAENNPWKTEKIFVLYFAAFIGFVLFDKIKRLLKTKPLYEKGFMLGDSEAMLNALMAAVIAIVMYCYDSLIGSIVLIVLAIIAFAIIWKDLEKIQITPQLCILLGCVVVVYVLYMSHIQINGSGGSILWKILLYVICQFAICTAFDLFTIWRKRRKIKGKKSDQIKKE